MMMDRTFDEAIRDSLNRLADSDYITQLFHPNMVTDPEADPRPLFHLGAAIMLDKPLILMVPHGSEIPAKLRLVADLLLEVDRSDPEAMAKQLQDAVKELDARRANSG